MQPTTVALGAGAALGVAFLMSRATGEQEEIPRTDVEDFGARASDYGPSMYAEPGEAVGVVGPGTTLQEWRAENLEKENPTVVVDPVSKITVDPDRPEEVRGADKRWSGWHYAAATGGAIIGAGALAAGGVYAADQYRQDQAYAHPDGPTNALALEEGRPE